MSHSFSQRKKALTLVAGSMILLTASACGSSSTTATPQASSSSSAATLREAGAYRDSRVCVKNSTSEILDIGPGRNTVGNFASLRPGQRQCFESNDTAEALANATILFEDDKYVVASAENFLIWKPQVRICYTSPHDECTYTSVAPVYFTELSVGTSADPVTLDGHTYKASRLADDTYWIVYEVDVLS